MNTEKIGRRILSLRKDLKLSQTKFSELTGIQRTYLSVIEKEQKIPSFNVISYLLDTTEVNASWLLAGKGKMYNDVPMLNLKGKTVNEIDEHLKTLRPAQREEIFGRTLEMVRMNEMEEKLERLLKERDDKEKGIEN
ncbi:MAG: hypothetical protein DRQ99_24320 [Candidatus Parabeggiatoa sp. nov. 3]|nr:MAG: hypothetical protein DRQ99_24320 [Gammaproteobacteria bacterium]